MLVPFRLPPGQDVRFRRGLKFWFRRDPDRYGDAGQGQQSTEADIQWRQGYLRYGWRKPSTVFRATAGNRIHSGCRLH